MNREKYQEALNELKDLVHSELDGTKMLNKYLVYCNTLQDLIDQNKPLTLDECIKEWEERGYIVNNNEFYIFLHHKQHMVSIFIDKEEKKYHIYYGYISLELNELLSKTLKALEVKDE